jgi:hypothetical protein
MTELMMTAMMMVMFIHEYDGCLHSHLRPCYHDFERIFFLNLVPCEYSPPVLVQIHIMVVFKTPSVVISI